MRDLALTPLPPSNGLGTGPDLLRQFLAAQSQLLPKSSNYLALNDWLFFGIISGGHHWDIMSQEAALKQDQKRDTAELATPPRFSKELWCLRGSDGLSASKARHTAALRTLLSRSVRSG